MSFAPKSRKLMQNQYKQLIQDVQDDQRNLTSGSEYQLTELDLAILQKLNDIECSLNPICNQHDALMPLLSKSQSLKNLYSIQLEQNQLSKKMITMGQSLTELSQKLNALNKQLPTQLPTQPNPQQLPSLHTSVQRLSSLSSQLKEIELNVNNLQQSINNKQVDASKVIVNKMNYLIDDEKEKIQIEVAEVKNEIGLMIKRAEENFNEVNETNNKQNNKLKEQLTEIENSYLKKINQLKLDISTTYSDNLESIEQQLGSLKCETETYFYRKKKSIINELKQNQQQQQQQEDKSQEILEIEIKKQEVEISIENLEAFTDINQTRLNKELSQLKEKLSKFEKQLPKNKKNKQIELEASQKELNQFQDIYQDLKFQIKGMNKQYFYDLQTIQQEIDILKELQETAIEKSIIEKDNELIDKTNIFIQMVEKISVNVDNKNKDFFIKQQELETQFKKIQQE